MPKVSENRTVIEKSKVLHVTFDRNFATRFVVPLFANSGFESSLMTSDRLYNRVEMKDECGGQGFEKIYINLKIAKPNMKLLLELGRYVRILRKKNYDAVVIHTSVDSCIPIILAKLVSDAKIVYFNHGVPCIGYKGVLRLILQIIEFINVSLADVVVTVGPSMQKALKNVNSKASEKIFATCPGSACGLDPKYGRFEDLYDAKVAAGWLPKKDELNVIYVGRPEVRKGVQDLLTAWEKVPSHWRLTIVGFDSKELQKFSFTPKDNIICVGYQTNPAPYYLASDAVCVPSHHEGFGYAFLEGSAFGSIPIFPGLPGPTDFLTDSVNGIMITPHSPGTILAALETIAKMELAERMTLVKKCWENSIRFVPETINSQISGCIAQAIYKK